MNLDQRMLAHLAHLARLQLEPAEAERLLVDLSRILSYFAALDEWAPPSGLRSPEEGGELDLLRADKAEVTLTRAEALLNAPETEDGEFTVPAVVRHASREPGEGA